MDENNQQDVQQNDQQVPVQPTEGEAASQEMPAAAPTEDQEGQAA